MTTLLLLALVLPAGLSSLLLVLAHRPWRSDRGSAKDRSLRTRASTRRGSWAWGLGLALAMLISVLAQERTFTWPPSSRWHGVAYLAFAQAALAAMAQVIAQRVVVNIAAAALIGASTFLCLVLPDVHSPMARGLLGGVTAGSAILMIIVARMHHPDWIAAASVFVLVALSAMFMQRHFAKAALATAAVSAAMGAGLVLSWLRWAGGFGDGGVLTAGAMIPMLAATGYAYDDVGPWRWTWGLAAAAPLVMLLPATFRRGRRRFASTSTARSWVRSLVSLICVGLIAGGAVIVQHRLLRPMEHNRPDDYLVP